VNNKLVLGAIVGQAIVTLVAIGYGASAHSSWEAERRRRIDGERAAVSEMATAMKAANDRLATVERELKRCQVRVRRAVKPPAPSADTTPASPGLATPAAPGDTEVYRPTTGPISRPVAPRPGPRDEPVAASARVLVAAPPPPWCEGHYDAAVGTSFAPCPPPRSPIADAPGPARPARP
jgi:hypothetical protein